MTNEFTWVSDVSRGEWIAEHLDGNLQSTINPATGLPREALAALVPGGFPALVRVLHPFSRDRLIEGTWAGFIERQRCGEMTDSPECINESDIRWGVVAEAHAEELRPDSRSFELLGLNYGEHHDTESADGWRYHSPEEGSLVAPVLARVAEVLAKHTSTPSRGIAAVWEGWGGLVSAQGVGFFILAAPPRHLPAFLQRLVMPISRNWLEFQAFRRRFGVRAALHATFVRQVEQPTGSGVLSKDAAQGPRLRLPDRDYICFEAGIEAFAAMDEHGATWPRRAPWVDDPSSWWVQSPNIVWPDGHEWFLLTEIDFDSTLVACSRACADELLRTPGIEAVEISRSTPLWSIG